MCVCVLGVIVVVVVVVRLSLKRETVAQLDSAQNGYLHVAGMIGNTRQMRVL